MWKNIYAGKSCVKWLLEEQMSAYTFRQDLSFRPELETLSYISCYFYCICMLININKELSRTCPNGYHSKNLG